MHTKTKCALVMPVMLLLIGASCTVKVTPKPVQPTKPQPVQVQNPALPSVREATPSAPVAIPSPAPSPAPITKAKNLWGYLESFRSASAMPVVQEIKKQFGEPNEIMEWEENAGTENLLKLSSNTSYRKFFSTEKRPNNYVAMEVLRYYQKGDQNRWIDVVTRKSDGTVAGWEWFENVNPGEEIGPPRE